MIDPIAMMDNPADKYVDSPPEVDILRDMLKRALWIAPALLLLGGIIWGVSGALSVGYGLAIVMVNFTLAALMLAGAARISVVALMAATLGGFLVRMALILGAVLLVQDASWVRMVPLLFTILITHLGLLLWETRYVSASMAYPGLKPAQKGA